MRNLARQRHELLHSLDGSPSAWHCDVLQRREFLPRAVRQTVFVQGIGLGEDASCMPSVTLGIAARSVPWRKKAKGVGVVQGARPKRPD